MLATISNRQAANFVLAVEDHYSLLWPSAFTFVVGNSEPAFLGWMGSAFTSTAVAVDYSHPPPSYFLAFQFHTAMH